MPWSPRNCGLFCTFFWHGLAAQGSTVGAIGSFGGDGSSDGDGSGDEAGIDDSSLFSKAADFGDINSSNGGGFAQMAKLATSAVSEVSKGSVPK